MEWNRSPPTKARLGNGEASGVTTEAQCYFNERLSWLIISSSTVSRLHIRSYHFPQQGATDPQSSVQKLSRLGFLPHKTYLRFVTGLGCGCCNNCLNPRDKGVVIFPELRFGRLRHARDSCKGAALPSCQRPRHITASCSVGQ